MHHRCPSGAPLAITTGELGEPRTGTKGNAGQQSTYRAQDRERVSQALERVRHLPSDTQGRSRVRESRTHGSVRGAPSYPFGVCTQLLLITAQRRSMVSRSGIREFDFKIYQRWSIPKEHTKKVKQMKPHLVPVTDWMQTLFERAMEESASKTLLFSTNGEASISGWSKYKDDLDEKMLEELRREAKAAGENPDAVSLVRWTLHDLRGTASTRMVDKPLKVEREIGRLILHHIPAEWEELDVTYMLVKKEDEMREALEKWGTELRRILASGHKLPDEKGGGPQMPSAALA